MESYRTGDSATVPDLGGRNDAFSNLARDQGFTSVYATPLRRHIYTIGALNLFASRAYAFTDELRAIADAFARITAMAILVDRRGNGTGDRIEEALHARVAIERAKSMVMQRSRAGEEEAFATIHAHAKQNLLPIAAVAREIVERRLTL